LWMVVAAAETQWSKGGFGYPINLSSTYKRRLE